MFICKRGLANVPAFVVRRNTMRVSIHCVDTRQSARQPTSNRPETGIPTRTSADLRSTQCNSTHFCPHTWAASHACLSSVVSYRCRKCMIAIYHAPSERKKGYDRCILRNIAMRWATVGAPPLSEAVAIMSAMSSSRPLLERESKRELFCLNVICSRCS